MDKKDLPFLTWEERNKIKEAARITKDNGGTIVPIDTNSNDLPFLSWEDRKKVKEASEIQRSVRDDRPDDLEAGGAALFYFPILLRELLLDKGHPILAFMFDSLVTFLWYKVTMFTIDCFFTYGFPKEFFTSRVYFTTYIIPLILVLAFGAIVLINGVHAIKDIGYILKSIFIPKKKSRRKSLENTNIKEVKEVREEVIQEHKKEEIIINLFKEKEGKSKIKEEPLFVEISEKDDLLNKDELIDRAIMYISNLDYISESELQNKFKIGYSRAARIIDQLEAIGYVSKWGGSKLRKVLKH